ncbi:MAG: D-aminoacylase, partial [Planctomycetota bacterium]
MIALLAVMLAAGPAGALERFDVVLQGGKVVDGTGAPWYVADVGIRDGKIARIGRIEAGHAERQL